LLKRIEEFPAIFCGISVAMFLVFICARITDAGFVYMEQICL